MRDDHHIAPFGRLADSLSDERLEVLARRELRKGAREPDACIHPRPAESLDETSEQALAPLGIGNEVRLDSRLLRGPGDDLLVNVPEAQLLRGDATDALAARSSRV